MAARDSQGTTEIARGEVRRRTFDRAVRQCVGRPSQRPEAAAERFAGQPVRAQEFASLCWQMDQLLDIPRALTAHEDQRLTQLSDRLLELLG